jgi:hypothetical protein
MAFRIISFLAGGLFGTIGAIIAFHWFEKTEIRWGIVGLAALLMGILAAAFGKRFWGTAVGLWP